MTTSSFPSCSAWVLLSLFGSRLAAAEIPTASMPLEDEEAPTTNRSVSTASPAASASQQDPDGGRPTSIHTAPSTRVTSPLPSTDGPNAPIATTVEIPSLGEPSRSSSANSRPGYARLSILVREPGATAYVVPLAQGFDPRQPDSALLTCTAQCSVELPLGSYTVWVKSAEDVHSRVELQVRGSRWVNVAPANQVMRDFGFVAGTVGTLATILGVAILAEAVCETCTPTGRNITGALALGVGLPMGAVGWSLYFIHREARIDDRALTQTSSIAAQAQGGLLNVQFAF